MLYVQKELVFWGFSDHRRVFMRNKKITDCYKNAVGTMFLLAGAFFVCSTLLSMRAVLADPIAPTTSATNATPQSARANNSSRRQRTSPRGNVVNAVNVARTTSDSGVNSANATDTSRSVSGRRIVSRGNAKSLTAQSNAANSVSGRKVVSRVPASTRVRSVVARTAVSSNVTSGTRAGVSGSASSGIRNSKATSSSSLSSLSSKLYTGNYSNIVDSATGLISADAYSTCLESYYTCMDEICMARNATQGRCACAARTKAFAVAENALETANEELIKVSGELALLIANKGKDVSSAFQLTDAEKVMNCVSWKEMSSKYSTYKYICNGKESTTNTGSCTDAATYWCQSHGFYESGSCGKSTQPSYCSSSGNNFGFDIKNLDGSGSDILASLQAWADAKDNAVSILVDDNTNLLSQYTEVMNIVSGMGLNASTTSTNSDLDNLANTWGYELFQYAHNNVCSRVLDSCFNGIYEACGTPPSGGKCANSATSSCPYNYNSNITVSAKGDVVLNERGSSVGATNNSNVACFGYTTTSGDPYSSLRGPVADARRSIMQKYLLDSNAACDTYGEQLRTTAQNIGYQKVAAQQALQQKRLEFIQEEEEQIASEFSEARVNFNECWSELLDCYETQAESNSSWPDARIKSYCQMVSNVPHCYEQMICEAPNNKLDAVITRDEDSNRKCNNSEDYSTNTCRNVITLSEILSGKFADGASEGSSAKMREACLQATGVEDLREWKRPSK